MDISSSELLVMKCLVAEAKAVLSWNPWFSLGLLCIQGTYVPLLFQSPVELARVLTMATVYVRSLVCAVVRLAFLLVPCCVYTVLSVIQEQPKISTSPAWVRTSAVSLGQFLKLRLRPTGVHRFL